MDWTYRIDRSHNLIITKMSGDIDVPETRKTYKAISSDSEFSKNLVIFMDNTDLRQDTVNYDIIHREKNLTIDFMAPFTGTRIAVLHGNYKDYGIGRQWEAALIDLNVEFRNFMDEAEAKEWLGIPKDYVITTDAS
ncbi:MAG: hypothetical protein V7727_14005 [Sneathiella sp.]